MSSTEPSSHKAFGLGNMADDLVSLTLELCGKAEDNKPRFPRLFYPSYVDRIVNTALDVQELIIEANEIRRGDTRRAAQQQAAAKCVYLNHLIRIAHERGYISEKQRDRWQKLVTAIKWATVKWMQSDDAHRAKL